MSKTKQTHVQLLRTETEAVQSDLRAEYIALARMCRESLIVSAARTVELEKTAALAAGALFLVSIWMMLHALGM